jgi:hypothetical protein
MAYARLKTARLADVHGSGHDGLARRHCAIGFSLGIKQRASN